jgi:hypothetical protein
MFEEIIEKEPAQEKEAKEEPIEKPSPHVEPAPIAGGPYGFVIGQLLKYHAHPISVHIPNGVLPVSFIFIILATLFGFTSLGTAALLNMVFVVISLPFVLFSGYVEWKNRYQGLMSSLFIIKITSAAIVSITAILLVIWWVIDPGVLQAPSLARKVFIFVSLIMLAAAGIAGHIGGKLVFKD